MDKRKHADHYHVYVGIPGYLPQSMFACETLAEAGDIAYAEACDYRDAGYRTRCNSYTGRDDHIGHVTGNKRDGYEVNSHQYIQENSNTFVWMTISIEYCNEEDCRCSVCHELIPTYDGICINDCQQDDTE